MRAKILFISDNAFGKKLENKFAECVASKMLVGQGEAKETRAASVVRKQDSDQLAFFAHRKLKDAKCLTAATLIRILASVGFNL